MSELQEAVAAETQKRMQKAVGDIHQKYASGQGGQDRSENGPTGSAYKGQDMEAKQQRAYKKALKEAEEQAREEAILDNKLDRAIENDEVFDDDAELERLRELRLKEMKAVKETKIENIGKGHGSLREIVQDEFLTAVTGSNRVICHFYHRDFERCKVMDMHLNKLAPQHVETKFIKIDAEKAPFFCEKLIIRTMPTLVCFVDGLAVEKIMGFEGLSDTMPEGREDEWPTVYLAKLLADKGIVDSENVVDDDDKLEKQEEKLNAMRLAFLSGGGFDDLDLEDDDDFDGNDL